MPNGTASGKDACNQVQWTHLSVHDDGSPPTIAHPTPTANIPGNMGVVPHGDASTVYAYTLGTPGKGEAPYESHPTLWQGTNSV